MYVACSRTSWSGLGRTQGIPYVRSEQQSEPLQMRYVEVCSSAQSSIVALVMLLVLLQLCQGMSLRTVRAIYLYVWLLLTRAGEAVSCEKSYDSECGKKASQGSLARMFSKAPRMLPTASAGKKEEIQSTIWLRRIYFEVDIQFEEYYYEYDKSTKAL